MLGLNRSLGGQLEGDTGPRGHSKGFGVEPSPLLPAGLLH
jgi:hypothetical protein